MASNAGGAQHRRIPWRPIGWAIPVGLLTIPWLANFPWTASDFIVAGAIFAIVGGAFELAVRASGSRAYRAGAAVAIGTSFLLVWINLAVGIIGNEDNPLNLMFFGVVAAAIVGSIVARFRADGMARAMIVAAALQGLIGVGVLLRGWGSSEPPGLLALFVLIEFFAATWLVSAWCFRKAAGEPEVL
ncbi:MAG TPA: hypothetical protein VH392_00350 [Sphingomicrobium sp.]|jgi:hypothetical protein